ncbi:MAG TPA: O-methyltransferase [Candidatus Dormibacteraeota bacterium]|nr:O-methyltransferase [Candidatus Dormibacteraeota bacterium]
MSDDLAYLQRLHREPSALLLELEQLGHADGVPILDRASGRLLSTLTHCMQANRILELGTAYGYSTLWMTLAMPPAGKIWTIDPDVGRTEVAASFLDRAGVRDRVEIINQPALEVLPTFQQRNLDIVFIDAVKEEYEGYLHYAVSLLKLSGLIVVDNLLWHSNAAKAERADDDEATKAIRRFNHVFLTHPQLDATIIPVGDGMGIAARID